MPALVPTPLDSIGVDRPVPATSVVAMSGVGAAQGRGTGGTTMAAAAAVACGAMGVRDSDKAAIALLYKPTC